MQNCYLDTNILVYFKNEQSPSFIKAKKLVQKLIKNNYRLFVSPLVLDEFLYAFNFHLKNQKLKKNKIFPPLKRALKEIFALPNFQIVNHSLSKNSQFKVISLMEKFSLSPRDAYHLLTMLDNKIRFFATFDKDFQIAFKKKIILPYTP